MSTESLTGGLTGATALVAAVAAVMIASASPGAQAPSGSPLVSTTMPSSNFK